MADNFPKFDPVTVTWIDCAGHDRSWQCTDHVIDLEGIVVKTTGWLMHQDNTKVVVALDLSEHNRCNGMSVIPAGCIVSVEKLRRR